MAANAAIESIRRSSHVAFPVQALDDMRDELKDHINDTVESYVAQLPDLDEEDEDE